LSWYASFKDAIDEWPSLAQKQSEQYQYLDI
jgi:hypothetical protein